MKHTYDEGDYDDSGLEIIDLDIKVPSSINQSLAGTDPIGKAEASTPTTLVYLPRLWLRWGMAMLTLVGSLVFLFLLWPDMTPSLKGIDNQPMQVTPTPAYPYQNIFSMVLPANGVTYIFTRNDQAHFPNSTLVAVSMDTGKQVWRYQDNIVGFPSLQDGVLYIPTSTGIDALRGSDRSLLWHRNKSKKVDALSIENSVIYATSSQSNSLDALRTSDGSLLWHLTSDEFVVQADHDIVYTSSSSGSDAILNARKVRDGSLLWQHQVLNNDLQIDHDVVYAPQDTSLIALRASNGSSLWQRNGIGSILAAADNLIVASSLDNENVVALRVSDGIPLWHYKVQNIRQSQVSGGVLYLKTITNNLLALNDNNGSLLWQVQAPGILLSVDNGVLCFDAPLPFPEGYTYALRASNGSQLWRHTKVGDQPEQVQDGIVYVVSAIDGKLTALRSNNGSPLWQYQLPTPEKM